MLWITLNDGGYAHDSGGGIKGMGGYKFFEGSKMKGVYGRRWRKEREHFLKLNPLCKYCLELGNVTPATVVDHIKPHKGDHNLFWDANNWQPLCKHCHDSVKQREEVTGVRIGNDPRGYPLAGW